MARLIDKTSDDKDARIRFHISPAGMALPNVSYVALQRILDEVEQSMYMCPDCGWRGRGRDLSLLEQDGHDPYSLAQSAEIWYACPRCEAEIDINKPLLRLAK